MKSEETLVGAFTYVDDFMSCLKTLKEREITILSAFSPVHLPELEDLLGMKRSRTRLFTLIGGLTGGLGLPALAVYAHLSFKLIVYGKPVIDFVPWIIVAFEGMVLMGALFSFVAWVFKAGLPRPFLDTGYDCRFSGSTFAVAVAAPQERRADIEAIFREKGAVETGNGRT